MSIEARNAVRLRGLEPLLARLHALGEPKPSFDWTEYDSFAMESGTEADLVRILALYEEDALPEGDSQLVAIHAWRALAQRGTAACVPQLVSCLTSAYDDESALEELPVAIARFGGAAVPELRRALVEEPIFAADLELVSGVIGALEGIAREHEEQRPAVCAMLRETLAAGLDNPPALNAYLIGSLMALQDQESMPAIAAAFAQDAVATQIVDWDSVRREMGAPAERPGPPASPRLPGSAPSRPAMPAYAGDATMEKLLRGVGSRFSGAELRCLLLGSVLAVEIVPPSALFKVILQDHDGEEVEWATEGQARHVLGQVMALWNELAQFQDKVFELPALSVDPGEFGERDFQIVRALLQQIHLAAFLDGFEMGSRNVRDALLWREFTVELQRRLDRLEELAKPEAHAEASDLESAIAGIREYWAVNYMRFASSCKAVRRERLRKQRFLLEHGKVGRNDPCPCGSGKKFKHCCLM